MDNNMVDFGNCIGCGDTCIIVNEIKSNSATKNIVTCVKDSAKIIAKATRLFCCEQCLDILNKGERIKQGDILK